MQQPHIKRKEFLQCPAKIRKLITQQLLLTALITLLGDFSSFFIQVSKSYLANGAIVLSLVFLTLQYAKEPLFTLLNDYYRKQNKIRSTETENYLDEMGSTVSLEVKGKVQTQDKDTGFWVSMASGNIYETVKNYLSNFWDKQLFWYENSINLISSVIVIIGFARVSTAEISNFYLFALFMIIGCASNILFSYLNHKTFSKNEKNLREEKLKKESAKQDILNIEPLNKKHSDFLVGNLVTASKKKFKLEMKLTKVQNTLWFFKSVISTLVTLGILLSKIFDSGLNNFNLEIMLSAISLVTIYSQFSNRISSISNLIFSALEKDVKVKACEDDFNTILDIYFDKKEKSEQKNAELVSYTLTPFQIVRPKTAENDNPFKLVNTSDITFQKGDFVIFRGDSGTGKTTTLQLVVGGLSFDTFVPIVKTKSPGVPRCLAHQSSIELGNKRLIDELTLGASTYDRNKLLNILKSLGLYDEFARTNPNVLEFLHSSEKSNFSDGQKQRLALARTFFNLTDDYQIIVFDEATSKLDPKNAVQTFKFISEFCRDRLIFFSTHHPDYCRQFATKELVFSVSDSNTYSISEA